MSRNYLSLSEYSKAEELCIQMLNDRDALQRDEFMSVDKVWQTLGEVYRKQRFYDKAEQILLEALPYRRSVYGENSRVCDSELPLPFHQPLMRFARYWGCI